MVAVARNCYRLIIEYPWLAPPQPGQFVQLRWHRGTDPLLRRPFSIHRADCRRGELWLLIQVAGRGTADLVERGTPGMELDILGPLGRSFPHLEEEGLALLLGGGVGLAPLLFLAEERRRRGLPFRWLIGGAGADLLPPPEYFLSLGLSLNLLPRTAAWGERPGNGSPAALPGRGEAFSGSCLRTGSHAGDGGQAVPAVPGALPPVPGVFYGLRRGGLPGLCGSHPARREGGIPAGLLGGTRLRRGGGRF